ILARQSKRSKTSETRSVIIEMVNLAHTMRRMLQRNDLSEFGALLHQNWLLKKSLSSGISDPMIDQWYETAREAGAEGGKILGAGGGGFLLLYAPREKHRSIVRALQLQPTPFHLEPQGSKIIYVG
ncbi:MAG: GHMP kinase, partial [bacterium]|nr:GHMP kinase [bacterium]